jgi:hypothetical protein
MTLAALFPTIAPPTSRWQANQPERVSVRFLVYTVAWLARYTPTIAIRLPTMAMGLMRCPK